MLVRMTTIKKKETVTIVGKDVDKMGPLCSLGRNVNWCSYSRKEYGYSKKIKCSRG